ncbi:hypothetical protein M440DRAFT_230684 [Trichoderma longibrachiatum ATCC 18648]|uniref:Uncharacterized protein n=1 Tax=Trichoderma longibrachiatum ATCC 18648 TaxID=983965 RepID=A0A2T4CC69_TRILO|nr:hypothetical protein M440DRAFT_230684 [Trichoderma longibrachiatum ATCC 18648]
MRLQHGALLFPYIQALLNCYNSFFPIHIRSFAQHPLSIVSSARRRICFRQLQVLLLFLLLSTSFVSPPDSSPSICDPSGPCPGV